LALAKAALIHDVAEAAEAIADVGAIATRALASALVSLDNATMSVEATPPIPALLKRGCLETNKFTAVIISGIKELTALKTESVSESERVEDPWAADTPDLREESRSLSAVTIGTDSEI
jgi:hypothetical protein